MNRRERRKQRLPTIRQALDKDDYDLLDMVWNDCTDVLLFMQKIGIDFDLAGPIFMMGIARVAAISKQRNGPEAWAWLTNETNHHGFLAMFELQSSARAPKDDAPQDGGWICHKCKSHITYQREPGPCPECGAARKRNAACAEPKDGG
jgi:hypothetical protein